MYFTSCKALLVGLPPCRDENLLLLVSSSRRDTPHRAKKTSSLLVVSLLVNDPPRLVFPPRRPLLVGPFQDREILLLIMCRVLIHRFTFAFTLPLHNRNDEKGSIFSSKPHHCGLCCCFLSLYAKAGTTSFEAITTQGNNNNDRTAAVDDESEEKHSTAVRVFSRLSVPGDDSEEDKEDENNLISDSSNHMATDLVAETSPEGLITTSTRRPLQLEPIGDDLFDLNPCQLGDENSPLLDEFTNDELIAALGHLNIGSDNIDLKEEEVRGDPLLPLPSLSAGIETLSDVDDNLLLPLADIEELSDIDFTEGATDEGDNLLLPIEDNIFDYDEGVGGSESPVTVLQAEGAAGGGTQLELLELLDSLSLARNYDNLDDSDKEEIENSQEQETLVDDELSPWFSLQPYCQPCEYPSSRPEDERKNQDEDEEEVTAGKEIPPWLYCQPCDQTPSEAGPLAGEASQVHRPFHPFDPNFNDRDVDALLQLLQLTMDDPDMQSSPLLSPHPHLDEMAEPETKIEVNKGSQEDDEPQPSDPKEEVDGTSAEDAFPTSDNEQNIPQTSQRRAALWAAAPFLSTFGTQLYSNEIAIANNGDNGGNKKKLSSKFLTSERSCLGHRERIMGLDFSECGRFLATAAADSTTRIWGVAKNNLLATLKAHDDKFECLRVAWASSMWGQDRLARSGGANSAIAAIAAAAAAAGSGTTTTTGIISGDNSKKGDFNYLLATGGADGVVHLWGCADPSDDESAWTVYETLDHSTYSHFQVRQDANDKPQVYSVQFIDHWKALPRAMDDEANSFLMTSSDDHVHLWEVDNQKRAKSDDGSAQNKLHLREVFSLRFGSLNSYGYGVSVGQVTGKGFLHGMTTDAARSSAVAGFGTSTNDHVFGGTDRNPHGLIFVFDACYCIANGLLGVALSDGSLRLLHGRGICLSILQLPGVKAHLTSFAWDSSGRHLATSVATGHVITWGVEWQEEQHRSAGCTMASSAPTNGVGDGDVDRGGSGGTVLRTTCRSVLEGGHEPGRPLFGVRYCGMDENLLLSWGVDGRLCLWDAQSDVEQVRAPLATLLDKKSDDYPIYCVAVSPISDDDDCIAVGGGSNGGFVGIPVYLYNVSQSVEPSWTSKGQDDEQL